MEENKKYTEFTENKPEPVKKKRNGKKKGSIRDILDGSLLTRDVVIKQIPFIMYITFLAIIYIGNRYHAEKVNREIIQLQKKQKELKAEAVSTTSRLMFISRQSEIKKLLVGYGLNLIETTRPPKKLVMSDTEKY